MGAWLPVAPEALGPRGPGVGGGGAPPVTPAGDTRSSGLSTVVSEVPFLTALLSPGVVAVLTLVTSAFTQILPSQLSTCAVGTRPLPTRWPRPPPPS